MARRSYISLKDVTTQPQGRREDCQPVPRGSFRVQPHDFRFDPNLDLDKLNQLADGLEEAETPAP
jgi:hypothetical protein